MAARHEVLGDGMPEAGSPLRHSGLLDEIAPFPNLSSRAGRLVIRKQCVW